MLNHPTVEKAFKFFFDRPEERSVLSYFLRSVGSVVLLVFLFSSCLFLFVQLLITLGTGEFEILATFKIILEHTGIAALIALGISVLLVFHKNSRNPAFVFLLSIIVIVVAYFIHGFVTYGEPGSF